MLGAEAIADCLQKRKPRLGEAGFLMEKRRVGTARFMGRSTAADKGSQQIRARIGGAGSGPRPNFVGELVGVPRAFGVACHWS